MTRLPFNFQLGADAAKIVLAAAENAPRASWRCGLTVAPARRSPCCRWRARPPATASPCSPASCRRWVAATTSAYVHRTQARSDVGDRLGGAGRRERLRLTLIAPLAGWAAPLDETPDPVFAEKMLGDGIAIDPTLGELRAPCDGVVIGLHACRHAVTIRAANGAEILLHVGLETVRCGGSGFEAVIEIGNDVRRRRAAAAVRPRHAGAQRREPGLAGGGDQRPRLYGGRRGDRARGRASASRS